MQRVLCYCPSKFSPYFSNSLLLCADKVLVVAHSGQLCSDSYIPRRSRLVPYTDNHL